MRLRHSNFHCLKPSINCDTVPICRELVYFKISHEWSMGHLNRKKLNLYYQNCPLKFCVCLSLQVYLCPHLSCLHHLAPSIMQLKNNVPWKMVYFRNRNIYLFPLNSWITFLSMTPLWNSPISEPVKTKSIHSSLSLSKYHVFQSSFPCSSFYFSPCLRMSHDS